MDIKEDKDYKRMFLGLGISKSVTISKPRRPASIIIGLIAFIILVAGFIFVHRSKQNYFGPLSSLIDKDTPFYISLRLPQKYSFVEKIIFWKPKCTEQNLCTAYKSANIISWEGFDFEKDMSQMLYGSIEVAKMKTGDVVFSSRLRDPDQWLSSVALKNVQTDLPSDASFNNVADENAVQGNIPSNAVGLLYSLYSNSSQKDFVWKIDGDVLYIASNESVFEKLFSGKGASKEDNIKTQLSSIPKDTVGALYISNPQSVFGLDNPYSNLFSVYEKYPIVIYASYNDEGVVVFRSSVSKDYPLAEEEKLDKKTAKIKSVYNNFDTDFAFYFNNPSVLADFKDKYANAEILSDIFGQIYGLDIDLALQNAGQDGEIAVFLSKNGDTYDWMILSNSINLDILKQFGLSLFAIHHPLRVEKTLQDGSIMTELIAQTEGLEWSNYTFDYYGKNLDFLVLRANGETEMYIAGGIEQFGQILTNSEDFLNRAKIFIPENYQYLESNKHNICGLSEEIGQSASFSWDVLSNILRDNSFLLPSGGRLFIFASEQGGLCGYAK